MTDKPEITRCNVCRGSGIAGEYRDWGRVRCGVCEGLGYIRPKGAAAWDPEATRSSK